MFWYGKIGGFLVICASFRTVRGASPSMPTIFWRLALEATADPSDLKSLCLASASLAAPTRLRLFELRRGKPACGLPGKTDRFGSNPNSLGSAILPTPTTLECQPDQRAGPQC